MNKNIRIIGIDPGIKGAFCVLEIENPASKPKLITIKDFPVISSIRNKATGAMKNNIDLPSLSFLLEQYSSEVKMALIEDVGRMQTQADPIRSFTFGFATGSVHGILASLGIKIEMVRPDVWKASLGLDSNKKKSLDLARRLYPESEKYINLMKHDGRAEALLLAHFAATHLKVKR